MMSGCIATARQWGRFQIYFDGMRQRHGFRVFHAKDFFQTRNDFKGWSRQQKTVFEAEMLALIAGNLVAGFTVVLNNDDYDRYFASPPLKKAVLDSKYGLCFHASLGFVFTELIKRKFRGKYPRLNITLEGGHKNCGEALNLYRGYQAHLAKPESASLCEMTFATKKECPQLALADFLAYYSFKAEADDLREPTEKKFSDRPRHDLGNTFRWELGPDTLKEWRAKVLAKEAARFEYGQRRPKG